jgi:hypothetical protein
MDYRVQQEVRGAGDEFVWINRHLTSTMTKPQIDLVRFAFASGVRHGVTLTLDVTKDLETDVFEEFGAVRREVIDAQEG